MFEGTKVDVYYNLTKGCWSVRCRGIVVAHVAELHLTDVTFVVSEAGRQRVLRDRCKNVHAYCRGYLASPLTKANTGVRYNPYEAGHFMRRDNNEPVHNAAAVHMRADRKVVMVEA